MKNILKIFLFLPTIFCFAQSKKCLEIEATTTKNGNLQYKVISEYDKYDNLISKETIQFLGDTQASSKTVNEYDQNNKLIKKQSFTNNVLTKTINKQYDNSGNLTTINQEKDNKKQNNILFSNNFNQETYFNEDGTVSSKQTFEKKSNVEITTLFDAQDRTTSKETVVFNTKGKPLEKQLDDVLGKVTKKVKYQYDLKDNILKEEEYLNDVLIGYNVYEYSNGLIIKQLKYNKNGDEDYRLEFSYDKNDNQIMILSYYRNILSYKKTKTFDNKNNLSVETNFSADGEIINETTYKYNCK